MRVQAIFVTLVLVPAIGLRLNRKKVKSTAHGFKQGTKATNVIISTQDLPTAGSVKSANVVTPFNETQKEVFEITAFQPDEGSQSEEDLKLAKAEYNEMDDICKTEGIALGRAISTMPWLRIAKIAAAGAVGAGVFVGALAGLGAACHAAAIPAAFAHPLIGLGAVGLGGLATLGVYLLSTKSAQRHDMDTVIAQLVKIKANPLQCAVLATRRLAEVVNMEPLGEDRSEKASPYMRASIIHGVPNSEEQVLTKCLPTHTVGAVTHAIYHSPAVPIHESLLLLMGWAKATGAVGLKVFFAKCLTSPLIPAAGFPLSWMMYNLVEKIRLKFYDKTLEVYKANTTAVMKDPNFFLYRGNVHCTYTTLKETQTYKNSLRAFRDTAWMFFDKVVTGPSYLEDSTVSDGTNSIKYVDLVANRDKRLPGELKLALKTAIDGMEDRGADGKRLNTGSSWSMIRLQDNFGISFPTLVSRSDDPKLSPERRLGKALYYHVLATGGHIGKPVDIGLFNGHSVNRYFWGKPKAGNMFVGTRVLYHNKYCTISEEGCSKDMRTITVTLQCRNVRTDFEEEQIEVVLDARAKKISELKHEFAHGAVAGGMGGGILAFVTGAINPFIGLAVGLIAGGAASAFSSKMVPQATDEAQVGQFKFADQWMFFNFVGELAWDCQFAALREAVEAVRVFLEQKRAAPPASNSSQLRRQSTRGSA